MNRLFAVFAAIGLLWSLFSLTIALADIGPIEIKHQTTLELPEPKPPLGYKPPPAVEFADEEQLECLQHAIYWEARDQVVEGQILVAITVMNRVKKPHWPESICGVVRQAKYDGNQIVRHRCQFSFYCDGKPELVNFDHAEEKQAWELAGKIAYNVYYGIITLERLRDYGILECAESTFYHASSVNPDWKNVQQKCKVGDHIFYAYIGP